MRGTKLKPEARKTRKRPRCPDCKRPLYVTHGWGACEDCHRGLSLPIGEVASLGTHERKEVHLLSMILKELCQDADYDEALLDLEDELRSRRYFVIRDIEFET